MKKLYLIASIIIVTFVMHPVATVDARAYLLPHSDNSVASKVDFRESSAWDQSILAASATCLTGPVSVTNSSDSGAGSLRQAIADICSSGIINFDSSLSEQTINLASTVVITKNLSIDGSSFAGKISISGNNNIRVFSISSGIIATIDSLIIKNGATTTSNGGGIYNNGGMLTINNSTFISNSAVNNPYLVGNGEGGAVYNNQGELTINRSIFNNNIASRGGAISCMGGTLTVTNSSFNSNSAVSDPLDAGGDAGAIYEPCNSTITKSTFSVNTAAHYGGAILTDNDINSIELTNDTFYGNTAVNGGGIANYGKLVVTHNTFSDNNSSSGGAIRNGIGSTLSLRNSILANSQGSVDCIKSDGAPVVENINNLI